MIPIASPIIGKAEIEAVTAVLRSGMLAQGERVAAFEEAFAQYVGCTHAVAVSSGTAALCIALHTAGIEPGDEVITSPFSFIATANAIRFVGATPVFCDIAWDDFNLDPTRLKELVTERTRAIMPVHIYGQCARMKEINDVATKNDLIVIEDACQAHGAAIGSQRAGSLGSTGCFSFYPTKNMTCGEGGMITTDDDELAEMARIYRNQGMKRRYYHDMVGFNYRMTDIAAAIGIEQLTALDVRNAQRRENATRLSRALEGIDGLVLPRERPGTTHVFHQYTVRILTGGRDDVVEGLSKAGVGSCVYYPVPIHRQAPYVRDPTCSLAVCEEATRQVLSLPVHPKVSEPDVTVIADALRELLAG
ncbi:MAG: DegT/DnrJ/EryC1/StrS family aminotransferase [Methanopyri archaeon]|jgi:dTDP-4-amino-4,6-dideoxygalactose transaminase|nr:DegT/DnrJ/EryC1/StrS family aminotransferase [Methanopyri archaeon]